jgi:hypothetical protein
MNIKTVSYLSGRPTESQKVGIWFAFTIFLRRSIQVKARDSKTERLCTLFLYVDGREDPVFELLFQTHYELQLRRLYVEWTASGQSRKRAAAANSSRRADGIFFAGLLNVITYSTSWGAETKRFLPFIIIIIYLFCFVLSRVLRRL